MCVFGNARLGGQAPTSPAANKPPVPFKPTAFALLPARLVSAPPLACLTIIPIPDNRTEETAHG